MSMGMSDLEDRVIELEENVEKYNRLLKRILKEGEERYVSMHAQYMWVIPDDLLERIKNEI